jgi:DNA-binding Xre family transcriptional regulator
MITSNLKYIMDQKRITISKLVELSGVSDHTILRVRRTQRIGECKLNTLEKIAKALKCKTKDLFEEEQNEARR